MVKVHYSNMHERYDEWINKDSYRLAELDTDAEALCMIREGSQPISIGLFFPSHWSARSSFIWQ